MEAVKETKFGTKVALGVGDEDYARCWLCTQYHTQWWKILFTM